ncbi:hypothetical protein [Pseudalkalibacillus hwajinpoensis]|uniref:Uncharacterized protein n=1 Tax=Guptibacillus hwajinpoensis TaxID=208199 RepID=A0A4U1MK23_9BACL|nr:hypothetical protein [Pseudalkalibacillus hwajinpoensis]TKD70760.1 hypothetical protein FBF83_09100 [Pseudalkalibacillus hwajinpoensis]
MENKIYLGVIKIENVMRKKKVLVSSLVFMLLGFILAPFGSLTENKVEAATNQVLSDEIIQAADPYIKAVGSHTQPPSTSDGSEPEEPTDTTESGSDEGGVDDHIEPSEGGEVPPYPPKDTKDDPFYGMNATNAATNDGTTPDQENLPDPYYYSFGISDVDLEALKSDLGEEKAQQVVDQLEVTNEAMREFDLKDATVATNVVTLVGQSEESQQDPTCPPEKCYSPDDVEYGENDIKFYWWGIETSLSEYVVSVLERGTVTAGVTFLGYIFGTGIGAAFMFALAEFVINEFVDRYAEPVIVTAVYPGVVIEASTP